MVDDIIKDVSDIGLTTVIFEVIWWDPILRNGGSTGATRHVCSDKKMFSTFEPTYTREKVYMGNSATSKIKG